MRDKKENIITVIFLVSILISIIVLIVHFNIISSNIGILFSFVIFWISMGLLLYFYKSANNTTISQDESRTVKLDANKDKKVHVECSYETFINNFKNAPQIENQYEKVLISLAKQCEIAIGLFYLKNKDDFKCVGKYAFPDEEEIVFQKESLTNQAVEDKSVMIVDEIPEDYFDTYSGLGNSKPKVLAIIPLLKENEVFGVIELAFFSFSKHKEAFFKILSEKLALDIEIN